MSTSSSRARLPQSLSHAEAAAAAAQAALLGAGIAGGNASLLAAAFHDRLHEPYRVEDAPLLAQLRERPVEGSAGVTLSGSGPSVVVWVEPHLADGVARDLRKRLRQARVVQLAVADRGTHPVEEPAATLGATA